MNLKLRLYKEADFALIFIRPESLFGEPVTLGPVFGPGDVNIISKKIESRIKYVQVTDAIFNFSHILYAYLLIAFLITLTMLSFSHLTHNRSRLHVIRRFNQYYAKYVFRVFELIVHQVNMVPIGWPQKVIWLFFCIAAYVTVDGFFLNLMSTDRVSVVTAEQIDSIDDLMLEKWSHLKLSINTNFYLYPLLKSAPPGTQCHKFYSFLTKRKDSLTTLGDNGQENEKIGFLLKSIVNALKYGNEVIFFPEFFYQTLAKTSLCSRKPQITVNMAHIAKENFAKGMLNLIFNKKMNAEKRSYLHFKYQNIVEFGVCKKYLEHLAHSTLDALNLPTFHEFQKCMSDQSNERDVKPMFFSNHELTDTYIVMMLGATVAVITLSAEFVNDLLKKKAKHIKCIMRANLSKAIDSIGLLWVRLQAMACTLANGELPR